MFSAIKNKLNALRKLEPNKIMEGIISETDIQQKIVDLNQSQMYDKGVDAVGDSLGDYRAATIVGTNDYEGKIDKGQRYDHITLNDSGEFYDSMKVIQGTEAFLITGNTDKQGFNLLDRWPDALGLTPESKTELAIEIKQRVLDKIKSSISV